MGGVDLLDMMCTLYKRQLKSKRWYLYIFYHTLTIAVVNAWFLYRRDCKHLAIAKSFPLKQFQGMVAAALVKKDKVSRGRPSGLTPPQAKKQRVMPGPVNDVRYDNTNHFPMIQKKRNRCRLCTKGYTSWRCSKCLVHLCLVPDRNCFLSYHKKSLC